MGNEFPQVTKKIAYGIWPPVVSSMHADTLRKSLPANDYAHYARPNPEMTMPLGLVISEILHNPLPLLTLCS
jgi:hypothetical protein